MGSPGQRPVRRPSLLSRDEAYYPRSGTLTSLIRTRSQTSLAGAHRSSTFPLVGHGDEEEAVSGGLRVLPVLPRDDDEIGKLLKDEQRLSEILQGPQTTSRSRNLIGKSNPRYQWDKHWTHEHDLDSMSKSLRKYYERNNELIQQYMYIDRLLDSSIPLDLLNEYSAELGASAFRAPDVPDTIHEESSPGAKSPDAQSGSGTISYGSTDSIPQVGNGNGSSSGKPQHMRTPKDIFRSSESMPLLQREDDDEEPEAHVTRPSTASSAGPKPILPWLEDADVDSDSPVVTLAIWINMIANIVLLIGKIIVITTVPSMSVLASLVDAVLDFLSTAIVWTTTHLISSSQKDQYNYPVGRRRLEPLGVLVFSIIMITSFVQVALQCIQRLAGSDHEILELGIPAIGIMVGTILIKGAVWLWCRLVKNSSVRALAADAITDVIFNTGSILFPIIGFYAKIWWLDALGGLLLSMVVIFNWTQTSAIHVRNLTGFSAQPDERNLLLYLTMRFATAIRQIQNLRAYHAGDKLFVEVDIVLSANTPLKDSHDLSEVLTYFLESVPIVDRAFVHVDYASYNAPTHILKQSST